MNCEYICRIGCKGIVSLKGKKYLLPHEFRKNYGELKIYESGQGFYLVCPQGRKVYCQDVSSIDEISLCEIRNQ